MIGVQELLIIFGIALLLFGGKKLPQLAKALGESISVFKKAVDGKVNESSKKSI